MHVIVVGAGIGGLTAALSLRAAGIEVTVVEAVRQPRPLGVGINVQPHAARELIDLGLAEALAATDIATEEVVHTDRHGGRIWAEPARAEPRLPVATVLDSSRTAADAAARRGPAGPSRRRGSSTRAEFAGAREDTDGVTVRVRDRGSGRQRMLRGEVLVGADGLHSAVRARYHPRPAQATPESCER